MSADATLIKNSIEIKRRNAASPNVYHPNGIVLIWLMWTEGSHYGGEVRVI